MATSFPKKVALLSSPRWRILLGPVALCLVMSALVGCPPDNTPLLEENERLQKQISKQEPIIATLQEGNRVLQQQVDLLNQELRETKKELDQKLAKARAQGEDLASDRTKLAAQIATLQKDNAKLVADAQWLRTLRTQMRKALYTNVQDAKTQILNDSFDTVTKALNQTLTRNGYPTMARMATDQMAAVVTTRKTSPPPSLELQGFRNQYLILLEKISGDKTKLSVKAHFEKVADRGQILEASKEEITEIELRFIDEIQRTLKKPDSPKKPVQKG